MTEIDEIWKKLNKQNSPYIPLQKYYWSEKYGWCQDQFGLSWQIMFSENENKIAPALLFMDKLFGRGEEAIQFYTSKFKNSETKVIHKDPNTNAILHSIFTLDGQDFVLMEGQTQPVHHVTPAISFVVECENQDEVDYFWKELSEGGSKGQCGWLTDKFGISWQIVPEVMRKMMSDSNQEKVEKMTKELLTMTKLDIQKLTNAFNSP